jgi:DNA-binding response OmpR family regulator
MIAKSKRKLLIIDDDTELLDSLKLYLESKDFFVTIATNGDDAIYHIQHNHYDLVLTDIEMPQKNGLEISETMTEGLGVSVPIVIMTGRASMAYLAEAIRVGISDFIAKPIQPALLVEIINSQINKARRKTLDFELDHSLVHFCKSYIFYPDEFFSNSIVRFLCSEIQKNLSLSAQKKNSIYLVLEEAISNAFLHGIWQLTPAEKMNDKDALIDIIYKKTIDGAIPYIQMPHIEPYLPHLDKINTHHIFVEICFDSSQQKIRIVIKDSGQGFDYEKYEGGDSNKLDHKSFVGRGLFIIKTLCEKMTFGDNGSKLEIMINVSDSESHTKVR